MLLPASGRSCIKAAARPTSGKPVCLAVRAVRPLLRSFRDSPSQCLRSTTIPVVVRSNTVAFL
ncbi:hypothetical protein CFAEC_05440 [Corynebacterium faecale]|nr:hypothetical protein CFAEC_05440 [Corynebacterium faecale]